MRPLIADRWTPYRPSLTVLLAEFDVVDLFEIFFSDCILELLLLLILASSSPSWAALYSQIDLVVQCVDFLVTSLPLTPQPTPAPGSSFVCSSLCLVGFFPSPVGKVVVELLDYLACGGSLGVESFF